MSGDTGAHIASTELETDYEILGELGRGATAVVYRARDRELGRDVAIKVIRPRFADDDEAVARLAREARTVAQLHHPNIVTLYAVRRLRDGSLALVMQLVPGRTLRDMLNERGAATFERVDRVLRDVGSALGHAHGRGIVHRDVKPENIFIDETTGHALLSDFGVARSLEPDSQLTATGTAIGTPAYMSPEQIDGEALDGRSDLYSLGLVGWEMLTGRRPWEGEGLYSVIFKQKREELPPVEAFRPDAPDRLIYLVEGAIRKDPTERWNSADELVERASTIAPEGGWRRWHAERKKRRRSAVYSAARDRGDSILSAALETVQFRRDASAATEAARVPSPARRAAAGQGTNAPATPIAAAPRDTPQPSRRSLLFSVVVGVATLAAVVAGVAVMRNRVEPSSRTRTPTTFADDGGVEVPLAVRPAPADSLRSSGVRAAGDTGSAATTTSAVASGEATTADTARPLAGVPGDETGRTETVSPRDTPPAGRTNTSSGEPVLDTSRSIATDKLPPLPAPTAPVVTALPSSSPTTPSANATTVAFPREHGTIAAGGRHSCELDAAGHASCWGANDQGQLGNGTRDDHTDPAPVAGGLAFAEVTAGASHTCGVTRDGDVYCWGDNERGQLGDATTLQRDTPVRAGTSEPMAIVRTGFSHSCALARDGSVACWGSNSYGQLGTGGASSSARPATVAGGLRFGALATGWNHTCALTLSGEAYCWGANNTGQVGDGTRNDRRSPTAVATTVRFIAIAAGNQHTCAISTARDVYCWGRNNYGQTATGEGDRAQPTRVDVDGNFTELAAGAVHTCAATTGGQVWCWGRNTFGQVGDGTNVDRPAPVRVTGLPPIASLEASGAHTCAATAGGESYCWGYNVEGQLGDGTRNHRARPVRVAAPPR